MEELPIMSIKKKGDKEARERGIAYHKSFLLLNIEQEFIALPTST